MLIRAALAVAAIAVAAPAERLETDSKPDLTPVSHYLLAVWDTWKA
jgi:hypothetical protein